jgi:hypothetical protein
MTWLYTREGTINPALYRAVSQLTHAASVQAGQIVPDLDYGYLGDVQVLAHIAQAALDEVAVVIDGETGVDWDAIADALGVSRAQAEAILEAHRQH